MSNATSTPDHDHAAILLLGAFSKCISMALGAADRGNYDLAWEHLSTTRNFCIDHGVWNEDVQRIYISTVTTISEDRARAGSEYTGHGYFVENLETLIPGADLVTTKMFMGVYPDAVVDVDGEFRPVEIKRKKFDAKAKEQLRGYMSAIGAEAGYAVAPSLACDLDDDMIFIPIRWI